MESQKEKEAQELKERVLQLEQQLEDEINKKRSEISSDNQREDNYKKVRL